LANSQITPKSGPRLRNLSSRNSECTGVDFAVGTIAPVGYDARLIQAKKNCCMNLSSYNTYTYYTFP